MSAQGKNAHNMTKPDVLEVLERMRLMDPFTTNAEQDDALRRVAELIAADVEYDEAKRIAYEASDKHTSIMRDLRLYGDGPDSCRKRVAKKIGDEFSQTTLAFKNASVRRTAALAACRGL